VFFFFLLLDYFLLLSVYKVAPQTRITESV